MKRSNILLSLMISVISGMAQWDEPLHVFSLSTEANEFAPVWSCIDSILYIVRENHGKFSVYAVRSDLRAILEHRGRISLEIVDDSITYATCAQGYWIGQKLVKGARQWYTSLMYWTQSRSNGHKPIPVMELKRPDEFLMFPTLSSDGTMLVFASTIEGSPTTDLWVSLRHDNMWGIPYRMSGFEQSEGNEITPCFIGNDTLLFVSDGFGGKGGFDLFITTRSAGEWTPPVPVNTLNSSADDRDPCLLPNGDLLFISNRSGSFDLYYARRQEKASP